MHDVIDSPMARREKTVTAGAADFLRASRTGVLTLSLEVEAEGIANCFAAKHGDLRGVSTGGKNVPFGFSGVNDCREIYPAAPAVTVFSLLAIGESMTSCIKIESDVRVRDKNSNRATVGIISNFNRLHGSFPLLLSSACLRHYALLKPQIGALLIFSTIKHSVYWSAIKFYTMGSNTIKGTDRVIYTLPAYISFSQKKKIKKKL